MDFFPSGRDGRAEKFFRNGMTDEIPTFYANTCRRDFLF
ncbi:hypothetical protein HMPREF7215_1524 [Pyramidobacter piscolens W5455]|uniref:Uncharacterized protein n=1 Tax=Pyramidobacter piscolens W5455 TaxID=352165 RepID=A0ABM9ZX05_9BACT|nr:hypothetical protein HMPREF7215_1524 [Pyramidobacter piscolens W5455]